MDRQHKIALGISAVLVMGFFGWKISTFKGIDQRLEENVRAACQSRDSQQSKLCDEASKILYEAVAKAVQNDKIFICKEYYACFSPEKDAGRCEKLMIMADNYTNDILEQNGARRLTPVLSVNRPQNPNILTTKKNPYVTAKPPDCMAIIERNKSAWDRELFMPDCVPFLQAIDNPNDPRPVCGQEGKQSQKNDRSEKIPRRGFLHFDKN